MSARPDAIVVGAGHNGLVAAFYLARAGLKPLVIERRDIIGGAAVTEEFHPGFRNSSASYVVSLLREEIIADMDLKRHGYETISLKGSFAPLLDGRSILMTGDLDHDRAQVGQVSNRDYDAMQRFDAIMGRLSDFLRDQMLREPPALGGGGISGLLSLLHAGNKIRQLSPEDRHHLIQLFTTPAADILDRWFDADDVKSMYASSITAGNAVSLRAAGSAINMLHLAVGAIDGVRRKWAYARGGMGAITQAMAKALAEKGGTIRTSAPVKRILVENQRAIGVELENGERIEAKLVLANTDPNRTFLKLVGREHLDPAFAHDIEHFRQWSGSCRFNFALDGVPEFACRPGRDIGIQHQCFIRMESSYRDFEESFQAASQGRLPANPIVDAMIPTSLDDSLAPPGCHIMGVLAQQYPKELADGRSWDDARDEATEGVIRVVERYVPNFRRQIVGIMALTPADLEARFGLTGGDVYHGRLDPDQLFSMRPHPKAAQYRTPIRGLYLCGAGAHPGGGVSGAPGHNAAKRVLKDLRARRA
ncbi:MAG: NAD(P)/FAD-dependent oxidoreductase [Dongiaceae bacterium]